MILQMFMIKDGAVLAFSQPFFARSRAEAIRMVEDTAQRPDHQFSLHPEDFELFQCGEWNDQTGNVTAMQPEHVISMSDLFAADGP